MKKFSNREECQEYVHGLSIGETIELCVDLLMAQSTEKVLLTAEQFERFFKVRGLRLERETRGRKSLEMPGNVTDL